MRTHRLGKAKSTIRPSSCPTADRNPLWLWTVVSPYGVPSSSTMRPCIRCRNESDGVGLDWRVGVVSTNMQKRTWQAHLVPISLIVRARRSPSSE